MFDVIIVINELRIGKMKFSKNLSEIDTKKSIMELYQVGKSKQIVKCRRNCFNFLENSNDKLSMDEKVFSTVVFIPPI